MAYLAFAAGPARNMRYAMTNTKIHVAVFFLPTARPTNASAYNKNHATLSATFHHSLVTALTNPLKSPPTRRLIPPNRFSIAICMAFLYVKDMYSIEEEKRNGNERVR